MQFQQIYIVPVMSSPLRAANGGVLTRRGHTEASVDLARLAGFKEASVICEITNDDGTMGAPRNCGNLQRNLVILCLPLKIWLNIV